MELVFDCGFVAGSIEQRFYGVTSIGAVDHFSGNDADVLCEFEDRFLHIDWNHVPQSEPSSSVIDVCLEDFGGFFDLFDEGRTNPTLGSCDGTGKGWPVVCIGYEPQIG